MMKYIDLHIHSTVSDGSFTPTQIVERAARYELSAIAVTDHDAVAAIDEAMPLAQKLGIEYIPGIEISTAWCEGRMHILGYFIDHHSPAIRALLDKLQQSRRDRIYQICRRLEELGYPVDPEEVFEIAGGANSVGRPHIAIAMERHSYVPNLQAAFDRYLAYGKPAYVPRWAPTPQEAIDTIHKSGGLASIAHCAVTEGCMENLDKIIAMGIDAIEVYYPFHKPHQEQLLKKIAEDHNLAITGGSDCHGTVRGEPLLGIFKVPYRVLESLKEKYASIKKQEVQI
ncbi:PHP domain-containing protein [bacterium]|nr:PHP domain-containing protein [bacterium]